MPPTLQLRATRCLPKAVDGLLVLEGVDFHLFLDFAARGGGVLGEQGLVEGDALVAEHVVEERHHAVLDLLGREDAIAPGTVVDAEAHVRQAVERTLVVLCLEAEVPLDHDDDLAQGERWHLADAVNMSLHECELPLRLCRANHTSVTGKTRAKINIRIC